MYRFSLCLFGLIFFSNNSFSGPITLTPPSSLFMDGVSVNQGVFSLASAGSVDFEEMIVSGTPQFQQFITQPVVIDPAVIGSGNEHFLFDAPDEVFPLTFNSFFFQIVDPAPVNGIGLTGGVTFSALPDFNISLPTRSGIAFIEIIDINGNSTFSSGDPDIALIPDPQAAQNIDIFADGSLYFRLSQEDLEFRDPISGAAINPTFREHGRVSGFNSPVPLPGAAWLMLSAITMLGLGKRFQR